MTGTDKIQITRNDEETPKYGSITTWMKLSGMGRSRTYEAMAEGSLPAIKLGARTLIDIGAGLKWLASQPKWAPTGPATTRHAKSTN